MSKAARDAGDAYLHALAAAGASFAVRDFPKALEKLDLADQIKPNISDTWNLRGAIYAEQHAYEKAGDAFAKAAEANPTDFWPPYNLAQLLLMEKKYGEAAAAFQRLMMYRGHEELVQFKIVFSDLMKGDSESAKDVLDSMKFPGDTPAYYFAHAAWAFAHKDQKEGNYYTKSGLKVFDQGPCISFYDQLSGAGWVAKREADGSVPEMTDLTQPLGATPVPVGIP